MRRIVLAAAAALALSGCGLVPHPRRDVRLEQIADKSDVAAILDHYREVRNAAIGLLDPKPLSIVESGPMLAIDSGSFEVSQRLSRSESEDNRNLQVSSIETPVFSRYPLWFMVTAFDPAARVDVVQIFERHTPTEPWLLVAAPQTLPSTQLPGLRHDRHGRVFRVAANDGRGMIKSPQGAATAYADALGSMTDALPGIARDDFIKKRRSEFDDANRLEGVTVTQTWAAERVKQALRTEDGGALVWVTLLRLDTYQVQPGIKVSWAPGSPQQAFLAHGITGVGKLRYYHQVLLYVPGGDDPPRALGQFGGVVSADADAALAPVPAPTASAEPFPGASPLPGGLPTFPSASPTASASPSNS